MCTLCQATNPFDDSYDFHDLGGGDASGSGTISGNAAALPTYTVDQIADYLTTGYWEDTGRAARSFDVKAGGALNVDLSQLSDSAKAVAWKALDAWTSVSGIKFQDVEGLKDAPSVQLSTRYEQGDAGSYMSNAASMKANEAFKGTFKSNTDVDMVAVGLEAGKTYKISLGGDGTAGAVGTTYVQLYDKNGRVLEQNGSFAAGATSSDIEFTAKASGTYYVRAMGYGDSGSYQLTVAEGQSTAADITFGEGSSGAYSTSYTRGGDIISSSVNVDASWSKYGSYYQQTYIHEIGHALGLGHGGNYNGSAGFSSAHYANDSWQMSVMSYFDQGANPYVNASKLGVVSPQMADIAAIQDLYGTPGTRAGNTVYGDGTTVSEMGMGLGGGRAVTIYDAGGTDHIDLGSRSANQVLDLRAGKFSNIEGKTGNLGIAQNTVIENATTGSGADRVIGNAANNVLRTGGGNDTVHGGSGDDTIAGGSGSDQIDGGTGRDTVLLGGIAADWQAIWNAEASNGGALKVKHGASGAVDTLTGIETLSFGDLKVDTATLLTQLRAEFGSIASGSSAQYTYAFGGEAPAPAPTPAPNVAPDAVDDSATLAKTESVQIDVLKNDSDPDGNRLDIVSVDGSGLKGKVWINDQGSVTYDARGYFDGLYEGRTATETFTYTIRDADGATATASATVTVKGSGSAPAPDAPAEVVTSDASGDMEIGRTVISQKGAQYWQKVAFDGPIRDAIVVMGPASAEGGQPLAVRVRNVTDQGFEFQIDEWDYLDGAHMPVEISWMAGTEGAHVMEDGSRISFGAELTDDAGRVAMGGFQGKPIVMGQVAGDGIAHAVTHRIDNVGKDGFTFDIQTEEALRGKASTDGGVFYWVGIEDRGSLLSSGAVGADHNMTDTGANASGAAVFADMQTMNGGDTAGLRYTLDGKDRLQLWVDEEQSATEETAHIVEDVAWITGASGRYSLASSVSDTPETDTSGAVLEVASLTVGQQDAQQWHAVSFSQDIADAAVVMGPASADGSQPLSVRVRNVTDQGFEFQIDEWDYLDGSHMSVDISWMAGTKGAHELSDGTRILLGDAAARDTAGGRVALDGFADAPTVLAQLTGDAEARALTHRLDNVSASGFDFDVQTEEASRDVIDFDDEALYYAAIDAADGGIFDGGRAVVDHTLAGVGARLDAGEAVFADMQSMNGTDAATLRYAADGGNLGFWVEEERSLDDELAHLAEDVAWLTINDGIYNLL